jgi:ArsR family transcriptional regulator
MSASTPADTIWPLDLDSATRQAEICRIFANPHRIQILWLLESGERTVGELAAALNLSMPGTSQHLQRMKQSGIVAARRDGKLMFYGLTADVGAQCQDRFGSASAWS